MRRDHRAPMLLLVNHRAARSGATHEENHMRKLIAHKQSLTKTLAIAIAALGMIAIPVQPAQADSRDASVQIADAPREPSRSCYDYASEIYITSGWYEAASAYLDCWQNPNHPENDDKP